jgi:hypothetical protein
MATAVRGDSTQVGAVSTLDAVGSRLVEAMGQVAVARTAGGTRAAVVLMATLVLRASERAEEVLLPVVMLRVLVLVGTLSRASLVVRHA